MKLNTRDWYDLINKNYIKFYKYLDLWDKKIYLRFFEWKKKINVLDIWWWWWRINKYFNKEIINQWHIIDISKEMLDLCPSYSFKHKLDLNKDILKFELKFDFILWLFIINYIKDFEKLVLNLNKFLKDDWIMIFFHIEEKKKFNFNLNNLKFNIENSFYSYKNIERILSLYFDFKIIDLKEKNIIIWKYYIIRKNYERLW